MVHILKFHTDDRKFFWMQANSFVPIVVIPCRGRLKRTFHQGNIVQYLSQKPDH
ncbi:hypothetical protein Leryth_023876, partial [Lithospermum erythrorhizon]